MPVNIAGPSNDIESGDIAAGAVTIPKLSFDPGTQAELDAAIAAYIAAVEAHRADTTVVHGIADTAALAPYARHIPIILLALPKSHVNWGGGPGQNSNAIFAWAVDSSGAQNAECVFDFVAGAGTYTLNFWHLRATDRGIYSIYIDDVLLGTTVDGYNGSVVGANAVIGSIVLATSGAHTFKLKMETKNASSSNYTGSRCGAVFTRTA